MNKRTRKNFKIRFFSQRTLPGEYRNQILDQTQFNTICRGEINYVYAVKALRGSNLVGVALERGKRTMPMRVVSYMLINDNTFETKDDGSPRPICHPHELYINVICSSGRGAGTQLVTSFYKKAKRMGKTAIRLYALDGSINYWLEQGFRECEDPVRMTRCYRRRYKTDQNKTGGYRMTKQL